MRNFCSKPHIYCLAGMFSSVLMAQVPDHERASIDQIIGRQGAYVADGGVYRITLPREAATIVNDDQSLSPNIGLNSWVAFKSAVHDQAILTGQMLLLEDEVDAIVAKALDSGLEVTGLASASVFNGPRLQTIDVAGVGSYQRLASAFRECLNEIGHVRRANIRPKSSAPEIQLESSIDPQPLDDILAMRGSVAAGVYKAAIGTKTVLHGEEVGREMGMSTWVSFAGRNDRAVMHGDLVARPDDLQKVLKALCAKHIPIASVRNHITGEQPPLVFVHFWGEGPAPELARAIRYVLDVQVDRNGEL